MSEDLAPLVAEMERLINAGSPADSLQIWQTAGYPESKEICFLVGVAQERTGSVESAEAFLQRSIELDSDYAPPLRQLAALKYTLDDYAGVVEWATRYREFRPYDKNALGWLIFSLRELNQLTEAEKVLESYARAFPYATTTKQASMLLADARSQHFYSLLMAGRFPRPAWRESFVGTTGLAAWVNIYHAPIAEKVLHDIVYPGSDPFLDGTCANLYGDVTCLLGDLSAGVRWYETARELGFEDGKSWLNEALIRLSTGDFAGGAKAYRNRSLSFKHLYLDDIPEWKGEPLKGRTLLVHSEQGCGDVIQFIRYLPYMQELDGRVIFNTYRDIMSLLKADEAATQADDVDEDVLIEQIDYQICMMDIPGYLRPNGMADFPASTPYLFPQKTKIAEWRERLADYPGLKIGLVWAGNPEHHNDANRSASLAEWSSLAELSGISWFALQKGAGAKEIPYPPLGLTLHNLSGEIADFADTAAILSNLDLLISVDTSVAHLAGACDIPCWILLPSLGQDWRWRSQDEIPAWYPSVRLLQLMPGERWDGLLRREVLPRLHAMGAQPSTLVHSQLRKDLEKIQASIRAGKAADALMQAETALSTYPNHPDINFQAALASLALGQKIKARGYFEELLSVRPRDLAAHRHMVNLVDWQELRCATQHLQTAIRLDMSNLETWHQAATFFLEHNAPCVAQQILEYLLTIDGGNSISTKSLLAISLWQQGELEATRNRVAELNGLSTESPAELNYLIAAYDCAGLKQQAESLLSKLCRINPIDTSPLSLRSNLYLSWGDYPSGWACYDQGIWPDPIEVPQNIPIWSSELSLEEVRLLVYQDQGYGDVIQFFCLLQDIPDHCTLTLSVFPELYELLKQQQLRTNFHIITHAQLKEIPDQYDYRIGFMHLVAKMAVDLNHPHNPYPYLDAPRGKLPDWQNHCRTDDKLKIGIVWAGAALHRNDYNRSTMLEDWLPLTRLSGISLYNLQRDAASNQAYEFPQLQLAERNIIADCIGMGDTTAALHMLDIVISVDTAVAHLAAALGKETWLLLPFIGTDFRWQRDRLDCPWYPSVRIFRQQAKETWQQVMERVTLALEQRLSSRS